METLLKLTELKAWYDPEKPVLKGLSLELDEHSAVGVIGLNGAGKTTLMNVLCGLHEGFSCESQSFRGERCSFTDKNFKAQRYIVFSEDESFGYFSFDEYIAYVFGCYKKKPDKAYIDGLVEKFGFGGYRSTLIKDLSLGNRRKAYLITGFALKLPLLLLDEPVNGLDFNSTEALYSLIAGYKEFGTVMFSSHILESVTLTSDKVLVLENGVIAKTYSGGDINAENIRASLEKVGVMKDV
ncbi:ATP-binding cassette domain-containing protein [uncultured Ruminococcus sp.]|uniref:ATP-binding cassette domain-containing protein n=1 Tax=uncultured Ruminococcus sp. TaxID=165186 RepID=UPI0025E12E88|nr:ATP-binding cassette domain-containing protein [uncultured Ruminococcus sp.]